MNRRLPLTPLLFALTAASTSACNDRPPSASAASAKGPYWDPPVPSARAVPSWASLNGSSPASDASSATSAEAPAAIDKRTPSGFFLVSAERLADLRTRAASGGGRQWAALKENAEEAIKAFDRGRSGPENVALVYLVTKDKRFAEGAFKWFRLMAKTNVRDDSYLGFGDLMRGAAVVLNWCGDALTADQQKEIAEYLEKWTNELWFANKGSGWGLTDPGNNYYCAFVEGTAYAGYALKAAKRGSGQKFVDLAREKIESKGTLAYLAGEGKGGDWHEGANYGERAKQRLFSAFAAIASMGGPNYFAKSAFANESILYAPYQLQPGKGFLAPTGDLSRESIMDVTPFDRDYMQIATYWTDDPKLRGLGAWYLREVTPGYVGHGINVRELLYRDVLFPTPTPATPPTSLPLGYRSQGTDWLNARSSWDDRATSVTIEAPAAIRQSHAHFDTGSFVIWRGGWQAVDAASYGRSGLNWEAGAHNMINVAGHQRESGKSRGLVRHSDEGGVLYAQIDGSQLFTKRVGDAYEPLLDEWTRELVYVRPDTLVVYDRVAPKPPAAKDWSWRMHFPKKPAGGQGRWTATNGSGALAVSVLDGGEAKVVADKDLPDSPASWRLELGPNPSGRTLALAQVGSGAPPNVSAEAIAGGGVQGVAWSDRVVVFSAAPLGRPASLPFSYKVKDTGKRQHVLADMAGSCDVSVNREGGFVVVTVAAGNKYRASAQGLVRFTD